MSLIQCPECGKEVSNEAKACPNCGHPIKVKKQKYPIWLIIIAAICSIIALLVCFSGISDLKKAAKSNDKEETWTLKDLSLYNHSGEEVLFLSEKTGEIKLSDGNSLKTNREESIGDNAVSTLNKYDLSDFEFEFTSNHYLFSKEKNQKIYEEMEILEEKYSNTSPTEMLDHIDELPNFDGHLYYLIKLYEFDKKLYTKSNTPDVLDNSDQVYIIFYYIENGKISDINISYWY